MEAINLSKRKVLACVACGNGRFSTIGTLRKNNVDSKLIEALDLAHSLEANNTHSTKKRSDVLDNAPDVSSAKCLKFVTSMGFRLWDSFLRSASLMAT